MVLAFFYLGCIGLILSLSLLLPVFVGLIAGEMNVAFRLLAYLMLGAFIFGGLLLATLERQNQTDQITNLLLMVLVWTLIPISAAIPIMDISNLTFVNALFESVSGLTTSGATILTKIENWPQSLIFWRIQLQWLGGFLALITFIVILAPMGFGVVSTQYMLSGGKRGFGLGSIRVSQLVINIWFMYIILTFLCSLWLLLSGIRPFYAVTLAMTAVSTGGFLPFDTSLKETVNPAALMAIGVFLSLGSISIFFQRSLIDFRFRKLSYDQENYFVLGLILIMTIFFALSLTVITEGEENIHFIFLIEAFMNSASLVSTSAIESRPGIMTLIPLTVILFIIILGGSAFSISGGIKHYRIGAMVFRSLNEVDRLIYPNIVISDLFRLNYNNNHLMNAIWSFFIVAVLVVLAGTVMITATGIQFEAALTVTIAAFSTSGPLYSSAWSEIGEKAWPGYSDFSTMAKVTIMIISLLGRLEILSVLGFLSLRDWRRR
ncbi:TrkH family potassium uptake protein [Candidatus Endowatersipora endosymbiont of Watersipora subatra]|uniref:TrkH family potassium uptake protein n=1 Tax=Candidatus Endowatersipora endosymbiont of Watersipora subatra TaxID=3077946 RepID=UPI00312C7B5F